MKPHFVVAIFFFTMAISPIVRGQPAAAPAMEEIIVQESRTPRLWRLHIERAEDDVYGLLNKLISDPQYRISCRREGSTSSFIPVRRCDPEFFIRRQVLATRDVVADWRADDEDPFRGMQNAINNRMQSEREIREDLEPSFDELNNLILKLAIEHPELMSALQKLQELKLSYAASQQ
jgi:hypothetical protein